MTARLLSLAVLLATSVQLVAAGDDKWLSPVYQEIFKNPLPFPPVKQKLMFVPRRFAPLTYFANSRQDIYQHYHRHPNRLL
jgi:hypothetical protein